MEERLTRRYQEHQEELRAANEREAQSRNQVRELQQQVSIIRPDLYQQTLSIFCSLVKEQKVHHLTG